MPGIAAPHVPDVSRLRSAAMTAIVMDGNALRDEILGALAARLDAAGSPPISLATVLVGDDPPSQRYVRSKQRKAAEIGLRPGTSTSRPRPRRDRSRPPSPSWPPTPTCTASSSSCPSRRASTPTR